MTSHDLDPSPCHKLSHLLGPPSSVTYFMDGPNETFSEESLSSITDKPDGLSRLSISCSSGAKRGRRTCGDVVEFDGRTMNELEPEVISLSVGRTRTSSDEIYRPTGN